MSMGSMKDLLGDEPCYPKALGFKESTTSRDAAVKVAGHAAVLRERVLAVIKQAGPRGMTADEAATALSTDWRSTRPRVSELAATGRIVATGARRANDTGMKAKVWRVA